MGDLEKQFITSCQSILAQEGKEICEEILVMIGEKDEMMMEKAKAFCEFFLSYKLDGVNTEKVLERCKNYLDKFYDFHRYECTFKSIKNERRERKSFLDMRNIRLNNKN